MCKMVCMLIVENVDFTVHVALNVQAEKKPYYDIVFTYNSLTFGPF